MKRIIIKAVLALTFILLTEDCKAFPFPQDSSIGDSHSILRQKRSQQTRDAIVASGFEFIEPQSYFAIQGKCKTDKRSIDPKWTNRYNYYLQAISDATQIAKAAEKWPQLGADASKMYMYASLLDDEKYRPAVDNITKNIKAAATWEHPRWGWDPYITLTCDDPHNACKNPVDGDPRPVACYVNNTADLWSSISQISCCDPFFTNADNKEKFDYGKSKNLDDLGLDWMRTSGSFLVHEMMHTTKISQDRPRIIDQKAVGGRRIYGPVSCAKAATSEDLEINIFNADSYAEFMLAMYWKDLFNGHLLKPKSTLFISDAPPQVDPATGDIELVSDNDNNYIDFSAQITQGQLTCAGQPPDKPSAKQPWVAKQIEDYCNLVVNAGFIVNSTLGRYGPRGDAAGDSPPENANDIWISLSHDPSCDVNTGYEVEMDHCLEQFNTVLNGCNTDSIDKKWGGELQADCALWNITTRFGHDDKPPNGFPPSSQDFPNG